MKKDNLESLKTKEDLIKEVRPLIIELNDNELLKIFDKGDYSFVNDLILIKNFSRRKNGQQSIKIDGLNELIEITKKA